MLNSLLAYIAVPWLDLNYYLLIFIFLIIFILIFFKSGKWRSYHNYYWNNSQL